MARVLVVDDEPFVGRVIIEMLSREGYEVDAVERAEESLQRFKKFEFSLALIDIRLPDMDGLELAKRIHNEYPNQRIIMMSGGPEPHDDCYCEMVKTIGVLEVISKPFSHGQLVRAVASSLN